jgi:glutathione S-transferase
MKLIGMLDSPYVRRVAICLDVLGMHFEHEAVSVFSTFEKFRAVNPVVKAPTLVCPDGGILMESALILQYLETTRDGPSPLWSTDPERRLLQFRTVAYATAACDKSVQLVYETQLRPAAAQHEPWKERVRGQIHAAYDALELLVSLHHDRPGESEELTHATLWPAIVWQGTRALIPAELPPERYPRLDQMSRHFETTPLFRRYPPDGPGVPGLP